MHKPLFLGAIAMLGLLASGCGRVAPTNAVLNTSDSQSQLESVPGLSFATADVDVGLANGIIKHEYWYTNTGDDPLDIIAVTPSCSCTVPTLDPAHLAPGETGVLTVETDLAKKPPGRHRFTIDVDFEVEGEARRRTTLSLRAQNRPDVWVEPDELVMHVRAGGRAAMMLRLDDYRDTPLKILGAKAVGVAGMNAIVPKSPERANGVWSYLLEVTAESSHASPDRARGELVVTTDDPRRPELRVPIHLVTMHRVSAVPATVWLRRDADKNLFRGRVSLLDSQGEAVEVDNAASACESLAWEKAAGRFGAESATVDFTLAEEAAAGVEFPLEVRLKVISPCEQEVPINVMAPLGWRPSS